MQFSVTFRRMDGTDALKEYAKDRIQKIKKYFPDPIAAHVTMSTERHNHRVDVSLQLHNGLTIAGHESTENMYSSIDLVMAKIERQVRRYKDKLRDHKVRTDLEPLSVTVSVISEAGGQADAEAGAAAGHAVHAPHVVHTSEKFHAQPLSVAEAIMQLNLAHEQFLVFRDQTTSGIAVIYRREDGSYGLIETRVSAPD